MTRLLLALVVVNLVVVALACLVGWRRGRVTRWEEPEDGYMGWEIMPR